MLIIDSLDIAYHKNTSVEVASNFSFTAESGACVGLIGANGAGKSTLLKILAGELTASHGSVTLNNIRMDTQLSEYQRLTGYMPDLFPPVTYLTVGELFHYIALGKNQLPLLEQKQLDDYLQQFDLLTYKHRSLNQLSLGQRQQVSLAQALLNQPELLILDEPLNGLDPAQQDLFWQSLSLYNKSAITILASHHLQEIAEHCQIFILLHQQKVVLQLNLLEVDYLVVAYESIEKDWSSYTFKRLNKRIIGIKDDSDYKTIVDSHQDKIFLHGETLPILKQLFRYQLSGEWQW